MVQTWLYNWDLVIGTDSKDLPLQKVVQWLQALFKCQFGETMQKAKQQAFLHCLMPCKDSFIMFQTDIRQVRDPKCHYHLDLTSILPIQAKPPCMMPKEEAWLDVHLDKLFAKGVICPILPGNQLWCVIPLLLIPDVQSGQPCWVCQNTIWVNKWMSEYLYQLNNTRWYQVQLRWAKWVSMLYLKASFHNIPFEYNSSYDLTFVTHWDKFQWPMVPMGLMKVPIDFSLWQKISCTMRWAASL